MQFLPPWKNRWKKKERKEKKEWTKSVSLRLLCGIERSRSNPIFLNLMSICINRSLSHFLFQSEHPWTTFFLTCQTIKDQVPISFPSVSFIWSITLDSQWTPLLLFLVACYVTLHPALSVRWSIRWYVGLSVRSSHFTFWGFLRSLASLLLPKWSSNLK